MGLVGLLTIPMTTGRNLVQAAPQDFLSRPSRWMQWISDHGGTMTAGPNFAYALAARALRRAEDLDLSSLEVLLNGAEPIDAEVFRRFMTAGERFGLRPGAAFPAFGMAELGIGGSFSQRWDGFRTDVVDARALEHDHLAVPVDTQFVDDVPDTRELALLGQPVPGLEMRVVDPKTGAPRSDREVGELLIRGTSVTPGYYKNPEATAELLRDGWLRTGDLAYLLDGDLVICGRIKDVIIVGGRKHLSPGHRAFGIGRRGVRRNVIAFGWTGGRCPIDCHSPSWATLMPGGPQRTRRHGHPRHRSAAAPGGHGPKGRCPRPARASCSVPWPSPAGRTTSSSWSTRRSVSGPSSTGETSSPGAVRRLCTVPQHSTMGAGRGGSRGAERCWRGAANRLSRRVRRG
jgi:hypothetical protein